MLEHNDPGVEDVVKRHIATNIIRKVLCPRILEGRAELSEGVGCGGVRVAVKGPAIR